MSTKETKKVTTETIYLPLIPGEEDSVWVARNGHSWIIPRGKSVEVPAEVAEILRCRDMAEIKSREYSRKEAEKATKAMTPEGTEIKL